MNNRTPFFIFLLISVFFIHPVLGQHHMTWEDKDDLLSVEGESLLVAKLAEGGVEVVFTLDYKRRCEYTYTELLKFDNLVVINIFDCNRKVIDTRSFTGKFLALAEAEQIIILKYAIFEMIEDYHDAGKREPDGEKRSTAGAGVSQGFQIPFNHHTSRYFFAPSSYSLRKGEFYYHSLYFLSHEVQYGITDHLSVGMGTTLGLLPFFVTPKYAFKLAQKHSVAVGSLFMAGTWGVELLGNLAYATYTYGDEFGNITLGAGHFYLQGEDIDRISKPVINLSGLYQLSDYIYFMSENYYFGNTVEKTARYIQGDEWNTVFIERFDLHNHYIAGMTGFRFIRKSMNVSAFHFGLGYLVRVGQPLPNRYTGPDWRVRYFKRFIIPTVGYVHKLGKRI